MELHRDNGKENGNYYDVLWRVYIRVIEEISIPGLKPLWYYPLNKPPLRAASLSLASALFLGLAEGSKE